MTRRSCFLNFRSWLVTSLAICCRHSKVWSRNTPKVPLVKLCCSSMIAVWISHCQSSNLIGKLCKERKFELPLPALILGTIDVMAGDRLLAWLSVLLMTQTIWELYWMKVVVWHGLCQLIILKKQKKLFAWWEEQIMMKKVMASLWYLTAVLTRLEIGVKMLSSSGSREPAGAVCNSKGFGSFALEAVLLHLLQGLWRRLKSPNLLPH